MSIGKNIRKYRETANMSQESLARQLNVTQQAVDSWERALVNPRKKTIDKLASIFNVTPNELFGYENTQEDKRPKDLAKFLNQTEVMFDGEMHSLNEDEKKELKTALEFVFYKAKERNKRKKKD